VRDRSWELAEPGWYGWTRTTDFLIHRKDHEIKASPHKPRHLARLQRDYGRYIKGLSKAYRRISTDVVMSTAHCYIAYGINYGFVIMPAKRITDALLDGAK